MLQMAFGPSFQQYKKQPQYRKHALTTKTATVKVSECSLIVECNGVKITIGFFHLFLSDLQTLLNIKY